MVFGASVNGWVHEQYCRNLKKDISCYLVSSRSARAGSIIHGIPVKRMDDIPLSEKQEGLVIVGRSYENHQETVRMLQKHGFCHIIPGIVQATTILSESNVGELKKCFGDDLLLRIPSLEAEKECSVKIYAVTNVSNSHKVNVRWDSKYIEYIQSGAALTKERICALTDDTGVNVSQYNKQLCEHSAGYWVTKNDNEHEYTGLYHYSRGMALSDRQIEWIAEHNIDVVLKIPQIFQYDLLSFWGDQTYKAVCQYSPDYADAANYHMKNSFFFQGSIQIAKREIFREYYEWAFQMLRVLGKLYPDSVFAGDGRFCGYQMESLMNIWYIKNAGRFHFAFAHELELSGWDVSAQERGMLNRWKLKDSTEL